MKNKSQHKQKEYKEKTVISYMKKSTKKAIRRIFAIGIILLGGYYLLVSANIISSRIAFGSYYPTPQKLALIALAVIIIGLFIDDTTRAKIKHAFS